MASKNQTPGVPSQPIQLSYIDRKPQEGDFVQLHGKGLVVRIEKLVGIGLANVLMKKTDGTTESFPTKISNSRVINMEELPSPLPPIFDFGK